MARAAWDQAENVLCVRLDTLGDVLMTTPAIRTLVEANPARRITLLTSPAGAEVARLVPEIDDVIVYDAPWMKATTLRSDSGPEYAMLERLYQCHFDAAVIFTVYSQNPLPSAMLCYLADIPLRLAYCHENPYQLLTDWIPDPEPAEFIRHEVQRQLDLVGMIDCYANDPRLSLCPTQGAKYRVQQMLEELGVDGRAPWLVMHTGATAPSRRYPGERFAEAAQQLTEAHGFQVVFTGVEAEEPYIGRIRHAMDARSFSLVGRLNLDEMAALLAETPLLISNNTGPVHMAAAVGTPVVDLYALTNPQHTPWQVAHRVLFHDVPCKYCYKSICPEGHHDCLRRVAPAQIVAAACELLGRAPVSLSATPGQP
jgi:lipopolysaccharide heptosyltransferase II